VGGEAANEASKTLYAKVLIKLKNYSKALQFYKKFFMHARDKVEVLLGIAKCFEKRQDRDQCIIHCLAAMHIDSKNYLPFYRLGNFYLKQLNSKLAVDNLYKAYSLRSDDVKVLTRLGQALFLNSELQEARFYFSKALELKENDEDSLIGLARAQEALGPSSLPYLPL